MTASRKLAAILAADVVGYSRMMGEDEAGAAALVRERRETVQPIIAAHSGRLFKTMGDGMFIEFPSVVAAVECALAMQKQMAASNEGSLEAQRVLYRIGVHLGDVLVEGEDILGDAVNVATRVEGIAEPGCVCISGAAYEHVRGRVDASFLDLGEKDLKNIDRPLRVYAVKLAALAASARPTAEFGPVNRRGARTSIAVLPLAEMSGDPEQQYFADGISEDIIIALSKLSQLFVIARNSSFAFKGRNVLTSEIAKGLGVRYLLEGSVRKSGSRIRITAQLVDATTARHVWTEHFDREITDIFAVQDEVTAQTVSALLINLTSGDLNRIAAIRTSSLEAYYLLLKGRELWRRSERHANAEARALVERAVSLDPKYAPAPALLALIYSHDYINEWTDSLQLSFQRSWDCAVKAIELDETYSHAHFAMAVAMLWGRRHDEALREAEHAIALDPNFSGAHSVHGLILHYSGQSQQAFASFDRSAALDPFHLDFVSHFRAQALYAVGSFAEAGACLRRRILTRPRSGASRILLATCYGQLGRVEEARQAWREALRVNPAYSLDQRRKVLPYKKPEDFEKLVEGLRKAGLPEP
jgi:adenylate cyclase